MERINNIQTLTKAKKLNRDFAKLIDRDYKDKTLKEIFDGVKDIIIDDLTVYYLEECYSPSADRTFIMRQEYCYFADPTFEPKELELVNYYFGEPNKELTESFYEEWKNNRG